jgi:hypothetical protein
MKLNGIWLDEQAQIMSEETYRKLVERLRLGPNKIYSSPTLEPDKVGDNYSPFVRELLEEGK